MMSFCPWCGAPVPDDLHEVAEGYGTLFEHTITCIRCREITRYRDGGLACDQEIEEILEKKLKEREMKI